MKIKQVRHHVLRNFEFAQSQSDLFEAPKPGTVAFDNLIAFVSLLHNPNDGKVYCGLTAFNTDILYRFDPDSKQFESMHYREISEPFEVKVHRSLELASDGTIYGATACLYSVDQRLEAPGGALFKIAPGADRAEKFAVPVDHDYIQTITLDEQHGLIYGQTYPVFKLFIYDLNTSQTKDFGYLGSITHISTLDDDGCFWGTWDVQNHYLYKYDPSDAKITWYRHGIPNGVADSNRMYPGAGPIDVMVNGGDGYIYVGTCGGSLCRLDPNTAEVEYLGKPAATARLPGLIPWRDGLMLGVTGDDEGARLFAYDRQANGFKSLGRIIDTETGERLYRVHDICLTDDTTAYVAETDVPGRSGFLWECKIEL